MLTERELFHIAESRRENLILAETTQLFMLFDDETVAKELRRTAFAELVARWCLSGDPEIEDQLAKMAFWRSFSSWYNVQLPWIERAVPKEGLGLPDPDGVPGCETVLRSRLDRLFRVAGFIPVYNCEGAWFIPFEFDADVEGIVWADGSPVTPWMEFARRALEGTGRRGVRLQLNEGPELSGERALTGDSLMLALRMAAWRGAELPLYDTLRVLATGAFDGRFRLVEVGLKRKLEAAKRQFRDAVLIGPNVPDEVDAKRERWSFCALDCGLDESRVLEIVRRRLEGSGGLVSITTAYAKRRLPDMETLVDRQNKGRWEEVATQLLELKKAVSARCDPDVRLEFMSLLATALCHAGHTDDCRECIREARAFAREHDKVAKELRLRIDAAVAAQDDGDLEEFETLVMDLSFDLEERFRGPERDDLLMRYHGTLAQANVWGTLLSLEGFTQDAAKVNVEKAVDAAYRLQKVLPPSAQDEAWSNIAQDLNYRHLWYATFMPSSPEEEEAWQEARREQNNIGCLDSREVNELHLKRQRSLAYCNAWLQSGRIPPATARAEVRLPGNAGWMIAANRRHLGALAAAAGEVEEAVRCFNEGERALPLERSPVLASIRFALLVQAALSLRACGEFDEAKRYVDLAEKAHDQFSQSRLFIRMQADHWYLALHSPNAAPTALPQFYY